MYRNHGDSIMMTSLESFSCLCWLQFLQNALNDRIESHSIIARIWQWFQQILWFALCVHSEKMKNSQMPQMKWEGSYLMLFIYRDVIKGASEQISAWQLKWRIDLHALHLLTIKGTWKKPLLLKFPEIKWKTTVLLMEKQYWSLVLVWLLLLCPIRLGSSISTFELSCWHEELPSGV